MQDYIGSDPERWTLVRDQLSHLQARFDQEAEEFSQEGAARKRHGEHAELERLAGILMQHQVERFVETVDEFRLARPRQVNPVTSGAR